MQRRLPILISAWSGTAIDFISQAQFFFSKTYKHTESDSCVPYPLLNVICTMDSTICRTAPQKRHSRSLTLNSHRVVLLLNTPLSAKPCRFFQKDTCPLSADRCDFAHVKIQILPVRYSSSHPRPIQAGQRDYGKSVQPTTSMLPIDTGK